MVTNPLSNDSLDVDGILGCAKDIFDISGVVLMIYSPLGCATNLLTSSRLC